MLPLTNEEQRVVFYATTHEPTIPSSVTPDTPLSDLNLNWRERDLPEKLRTRHVHRLHPYLGKYIPQRPSDKGGKREFCRDLPTC
jgi:hypothetical protein